MWHWENRIVRKLAAKELREHETFWFENNYFKNQGQGYITKIKVTVCTEQKLVSCLYVFKDILDLDDIEI